MMTVRFPNGQALRYNKAMYLTRETYNFCLKESVEGKSIVFVPYNSGAIIEWEYPCDISNPIAEPHSIIDTVIKHIRTMDPWKLRSLKRALDKFSTRTQTWRY